jgi:hypothetical protein
VAVARYQLFVDDSGVWEYDDDQDGRFLSSRTPALYWCRDFVNGSA